MISNLEACLDGLRMVEVVFLSIVLLTDCFSGISIHKAFILFDSYCTVVSVLDEDAELRAEDIVLLPEC